MSIKSVKATIDGNEYTLTLNDGTGKWEASIPAPAKSSYKQDDHVFNVGLTAENEAGTKTSIDKTDETFGSVLSLRVLEKRKPSIVITSPGSGAYITTATPTVEGTVSDESIGGDGDSGFKYDSIVIKLDDEDITEEVKSGGNYSMEQETGKFSFTMPRILGEGDHTLTVDGEDYDGNASETASCTFKIDTVPPTLNVTSPSDNFTTSQETVSVAGKTNDETSTPVTISITVNGQDVGEVTVDADGSFSKVIDLNEGKNTIIITATDRAGKTSTVTRTVILDTSVPIFTSIILVPNPADAGATLTLTVEVESGKLE